MLPDYIIDELNALSDIYLYPKACKFIENFNRDHQANIKKYFPRNNQLMGLMKAYNFESKASEVFQFIENHIERNKNKEFYEALKETMQEFYSRQQAQDSIYNRIHDSLKDKWFSSEKEAFKKANNVEVLTEKQEKNIQKDMREEFESACMREFLQHMLAHCKLVSPHKD